MDLLSQSIQNAENGVIDLGMANDWPIEHYHLWKQLWKMRISNTTTEHIYTKRGVISYRLVEKSFDIIHQETVYTVVYRADIPD